MHWGSLRGLPTNSRDTLARMACHSPQLLSEWRSSTVHKRDTMAPKSWKGAESMELKAPPPQKKPYGQQA